MLLKFSITLLSASTLFGADIPITFSVTSQQAEVQYTSTINGPCTLSLVDNSGLGVTVWDVNGVKFPGSDQDLSRPDTLVDDLNRKVLLGHRVYQQGTDGRWYSLSLQADAQHTLTVTCGPDSGTVQFATNTIQQGTSYPELPQFGSGAKYNHAWPTVDMTVAGKDVAYVDAFTGALVKRVTGPGESTYSGVLPNRSFAFAKDQSGGSAWTSPANAVRYGTANVASTGTANAKLFIAWNNLVNAANGLSFATGWGTNGTPVDDIRLRLHASSSDGATAAAACTTLDGQTCFSSVQTLGNLPSTAADVAFPAVGSPDTFPQVPWQEWGGQLPPKNLFMPGLFAAVVNGTAVTVASGFSPYNGAYFDTDWPAGTPLYIPASSCVGSICTIASVTDSSHLVINESQSNLGTQNIQPLNAGVLVWKSSGAGSISLNASVDLASSPLQGLSGSNGIEELCSRRSDTTSVDPSGNALSSPLTGFVCLIGTSFYFVPTNPGGSARLLSGNKFSYVFSFTGLGFQPFDPADSRAWFTLATSAFGTANTSSVFIKSRYTGNFANNPLFYTIGNEPANVTQFVNGCLPSTGLSGCPARLFPNDVGSQFATLIASIPSFKRSVWGSGLGLVGFHPSGYAFFHPAGGTAGQDSATWVFPYDLAHQTFTGYMNTYSGSTGRWGVDHSQAPNGPGSYAYEYISVPRGICGGGCSVQGPYSLPLIKVWRSSDGVTGTWDANTCEIGPTSDPHGQGTCPGAAVPLNFAYACPSSTSAYWGPQGQNNCIQVQVQGEPCVDAAHTTAAEIAAFPCNPGTPFFDATKASLQTAEVGDLICDQSINLDSEELRIVQKTVNFPAAGINTLWLYRQSFPYPYAYGLHGSGKFNHANGWSPSMFPTGGIVPWWFDLSNPVAFYPEQGALAGGSHGSPATAAPGGATAYTALGGSANLGLQGQIYTSRRSVNIPADFGTFNNLQQVGANPAFDNSVAGAATGPNLETYVSGTAVVATDNLKRFISDYRDPTGDGGIGFELPQGYFSGTATLVSGFTRVYDITNPVAPDIKRHPLYGMSGRYLLRDVSGPQLAMSDSAVGTFCYDLLGGKCFPGSLQGHSYVNAPFIEPSQVCIANQMTQSFPCVTTGLSLFGQGVLKNVFDPDPEGIKYMRLTGMFNSPFNNPHFLALRLTPDGKWAFYQGWYAGGNYYRPEVFAVRIPSIAEDTVRRDTWVKIPVSLPAGDGAQIRFGYDRSFHCHGVSDPAGNFIAGYNDSCLTDGSGAQPFVFGGEPQVQTSCSSGCTINIPGISGRYLYYRVERYKRNLRTYEGPVNRISVP